MNVTVVLVTTTVPFIRLLIHMHSHRIHPLAVIVGCFPNDLLASHPLLLLLLLQPLPTLIGQGGHLAGNARHSIIWPQLNPVHATWQGCTIIIMALQPHWL